MHCPRCGTSATASQQFCRACGLGLEKVAELVADANTGLEAPRDDEAARLKELQRKHENWSTIVGLVTCYLILLLLVVLVFVGMILKGGLLILPGSFLILFAIGAGVMAYFQTKAKLLKQKLAAPELPAARPAELEARIAVPAGSITDRTTELLTEGDGRTTGPVTG
ncbi:MAG TPA: zinc ribbon domain-containing protein [Pyrinomonadaceae bacterium]|nr:zinc ribbon domain-containing protein [Pyrinomonadaceae bacterium]